MGADQSNPKANQQISEMLNKEISDFKNGNISKTSLRYLFLLMKANAFFKYDHFYKQIDMYRIADYINDLGFINLEEAKMIVKSIIETSDCQEVATMNLQIVLPKMRIKRDEIYLSPSFSKELFNQVFSNSYKTEWGRYTPTSIIDWNSPEIDSNNNFQIKQNMSLIDQNMPKLFFYIKGKDNQTKNLQYTLVHSEDYSSLIIMNHVDKLINMNMDVFQGCAPFNKKIEKPVNWKRNIHNAAFSGDEQSVIYCLHLLPILLNCPDPNGNTPAHMAAIGNRPNIIKLLFSLNADFSIVNNDGYLPHQISGGKNAIMMFKSLGFDLLQKDKKGETIFEIKTRDFNMEVIETLLQNGVDIFKPLSNGSYWMQFVIHGEFYKKKMDFITFQKKIRKIVRKNLKKDPIINEILNRKVENCDKEDEYDINESIENRYMDRIRALLALGSHADRVRKDGKTNLMLCAEKNDFELVELLLKNFCDPNFKNEKGQNIFWIAAYMKNIDAAHLLQEYGANINELSLSGKTILHVAYDENKMDLFYYLLDVGCSPNILNKNKETVLFQAFFDRDDQLAELLQDNYKGNINIKSQDDNSLAHISILEQDFDRTNYYISRGIDIELKNSYGYTIFMISITMLDNLQYSSSLLANGANIDTQDFNGNTALLNVLHAKKFNKEKFDFLINNKCDINKQNTMGEFPISVCIIRQLNDEAKFLLDKGCKITDKQSEFEPIANALKINSQYWFEILLEKGATASNEKFPVLSSYMNSTFFNFDLLKKFKEINTVIGAPIQTALRKKYNEIALYLWDISNNQTRYKIAKETDSFGMIPISVSIVFNCEQLVNYILDDHYEVMIPDGQNRTPFSYACQANQIDWMNKINSQITLQNANLVDKNGNSALTYAADNNNIDFCNFLFIHGIEVFNINADQNGIIIAYRKLISKFEEFKNIAYRNYDNADKNFKYWNSQVLYYTRQIEMANLRNNTSHHNSSSNLSVVLDIIGVVCDTGTMILAESNRNRAIENRNDAQIIRNKYQARYSQIKVLTRKDLLTNFHLVANLARNDNDIDSAPSIDFDIDSFLRSINVILK